MGKFCSSNAFIFIKKEVSIKGIVKESHIMNLIEWLNCDCYNMSREMKIKCMLNLCEGGYIYEIIRLVECISF